MDKRLYKIGICLWAVLGSCGHRSSLTEKVPVDSTIPSQIEKKPASPDSTRSDSSPSVAGVEQQVAYLTANLNDDSIPDTLRLYSSTRDTAEFDEIKVTLAGYESKTFHTKDPWTQVDRWFLDSAINQLPTKRLLLTRWKQQAVLLLFGTPDEVGNGSNFCIINIEHNQIKLVLDQSERNLDVEVPFRLTDLDGDGRPEFVYTQLGECTMDTLDGMVCTYSPYHVYTVDDSCGLNKPLTVKYNKDHYIFAGFEYNESIQIFKPNDKRKPLRIWKQ